MNVEIDHFEKQVTILNKRLEAVKTQTKTMEQALGELEKRLKSNNRMVRLWLFTIMLAAFINAISQ